MVKRKKKDKFTGYVYWKRDKPIESENYKRELFAWDEISVTLWADVRIMQ